MAVIRNAIFLGFILALPQDTLSHRFRLHGQSRHLVKRQSPAPAPCDSRESWARWDGSCNNLQHGEWGRAGAPLKRWRYVAVQSEPRTTDSTGQLLPTARQVSLAYHGPSDVSSDVTLMVMQFGQFLDHDITLTPEEHVDDCCSDEAKNNPSCISIPLVDDEFFTDVTCMPLTRSTQSLDSESGTMEQSNALTSFVDGSQIYGSSEDEMLLVRAEGNDGLLQVTDLGSKGSYLPEGATEACTTTGTDEYCFLAGDVRVNEQPGLAAMHTIFMREHNRVAKRLKQINSHWDGDRLFQETRKIVIGTLQAITYREFHPVVVGRDSRDSRDRRDDTYTYDANLQPNIFNVFATAAYRFGHSLIPEELFVKKQSIQFKDLFFSPSLVLDSMNGLSEALMETAPGADRFFSHSITRHLFEIPGHPQTGFDLVARNIQRGRDHHLPTYNEMRENCSLPRVNNLGELWPGVTQHVYRSIDDVDVFTGGMSEPAVPGGLLGPLFSCILSEQFKRLRHGDRFFYEHRHQSTSFTDDQIASISQMTLAKVVCENTENKEVQKNIFKPSSASNPITPCDRLEDLDFDLWRQEDNRGRDDGGRGDGDNNNNNNNNRRPDPSAVERPSARGQQPRGSNNNNNNNNNNVNNNNNNNANNNNNNNNGRRPQSRRG